MTVRPASKGEVDDASPGLHLRRLLGLLDNRSGGHHYDGYVQEWRDGVPVGVTDYERLADIFDRSISYTNKTFSTLRAGDSTYRNNYEDVTGFPYPY